MLRVIKKIQSMDSIESWAHGTNKEIKHKKGDIKCTNIIKRCNRWLTMIMLLKETSMNIIQTGLKYLIIHTKYW